MWDNQWFIGIASGLVVYLITNFIFNKLSKRDYWRKVKDANREITMLLLMSVSEERIPSLSVIKSLLNSLTRSYGVKKRDLNSVEQALEDLIREIFETKFISNDKKNEISESLIELIKENLDIKHTEETANEKATANDSQFIKAMMTLILSITLAVITLITLTLTNTEFDNLSNIFIVPFSIGGLIAAIVSTFSMLYKIQKDKENENKEMRNKNKINKNKENVDLLNE